jgi:transcriptional regulator with XRE-family HTH domain
MQPYDTIALIRTQKKLTLQTVAERAGTTKSQIHKLEKGERRLTLAWLQRIANALEVPTQTLLVHRATHQRERYLPLIGQGDTNVHSGITAENTLSFVMRPPILHNVCSAYAVVMTDNTMEPRYLSGDVLYVNPSLPLTRHCFITIAMADNTIRVRQFLQRDNGQFLLRQFAPARDNLLPLVKIHTAHRIVGSLEGCSGGFLRGEP